MKALVVIALIMATVGITACSTKQGGTELSQVIESIVNKDLPALEKALADGGNPNDADYRGKSALMLATGTDQFRAANALVGAGADIWYADKFGTTPASMAQIARLAPGTPEGDAKDLFIAHLREFGYPWPPPPPDRVLDLRARGDWPPASARSN